MKEIGPNGSMRCGTLASAWSRQAMDPASRAAFMNCPCGEVFDMHGT